MADTQAKEEVSKVVPLTFSDMIWVHIQETNKRMDRLENRQEKLEEKIDKTRQELNTRMDKLEEKIDKTRQELNTRMDKLEEKIDALHNEIKSSTGHISIANISTVGIALAVIYSVLK